MSAECRCGRPTRDGAFVCDDCTEALSMALAEVPWIAEELDIEISRQKGISYTGSTVRSSERPDAVNWSASDARRNLEELLELWVLFCNETNVKNSSPHLGLPDRTLVSMSRYLLWRVDGMAQLDIGPEIVDEITRAVGNDGSNGTAITGCYRTIDSPADRQYLGACDMCDDGRLYARPGGTWARCQSCDAATLASAVRDRLLRELDDRLCTAAEIAHLSTYLGLQANREQVRKRINQWATRGHLAEHASFSDEPTYRFGAVYEMLARDEYRESKTSEGVA